MTTFNEETLDNIFARLDMLDERLDELEKQPHLIPDNEHPDFDPDWDEPEDGEIEGLIDEEVDYDALTQDV